MDDEIRVLHIEDDPEFADLTASYLEQLDNRIRVEAITDPTKGLDRLAENHVDCLIVDYEMPVMDGLTLLDTVREKYPDLPVILFTGKGSEEVASEAISNGVTDYVQKGGTETFELLANRIDHAVRQHFYTAQIADLHEIAIDLEAAESIKTVAELTLDAAQTLLNADICCFALYDPDSDTFHAERIESTGASSNEFLNETLQGEDTLAKRTLETGESSLIDDASVFESVRDDGARGPTLSVPLGSYGVFQAIADTSDAFDTEDLRLVEILCSYTTQAIERLIRQTELEQKSQRLDALFETLPTPTVQLQQAPGLIDDVNPAFEDRFGIDATQARDVNLNDLIVPEEYRSEAQQIDERAVAGETIRREVKRKTTDGEVGDFLLISTGRLSVDDPDFPTGLMDIWPSEGYAMYVDITERKERERDLEEYETMVETIGDGVYTLDEDLQFKTVNEGMVELTGYSKSELQGMELEQLLVEEVDQINRSKYEEYFAEDRYAVTDVESAKAARNRLRDSDQDVMTIDFPVVTADDDVVPCEVRFSALTSNGEFLGTAGVFMDITERRSREQRLERQNKRFDELASVISHDLETPLATARGRIELARETGDTDHLEQALQSLDRVDGLRGDLVDVLRSREIVTEMTTVDIEALANDAWQTLDPTVESTLTVNTNQEVYADRDALQRCLENLFSNSLEHGEEPVTIQIGELNNGIYIEDNGPGIAPSNRSEVFKPGETTKDDGNGMGMTSVRQIIQAHDWEIKIVDAETLSGVRFEIMIE